MSDDWNESAAPWIAQLGDEGNFERKYILDQPMLARVEGRNFQTALDVGCGEGRFCRMMQNHAIATVGIDPSETLIGQARKLDPRGDYRIGQAEGLELPDAGFDLVVGYLVLVNIPNLDAAISEMTRVLRPGGTLLIANVTSFATARVADGWLVTSNLDLGFAIDSYLDERILWQVRDGIRVQNWHRPLERYMSAFLGHGLILSHFAEPEPYGGDPEMVERFRRVPWYILMEWRKP